MEFPLCKADVGKYLLYDHRPKAATLTESLETMVREAKNLQRQNRTEEAVAGYQRVLERWPDNAECWFNLAVLQRQARQLTEALDSYQKALDARVSRPEEAHLNRSVIYADYLGQHAAAERELQQALALNPRYTPAGLNLANLYEDLGFRDQAAALYLQILAVDPDCFEALARYANLQPRLVVDPALIAKLKGALANSATAASEQASLGFALGRLLDAAGEYGAAFSAYTTANQASEVSAAPNVAHYERDIQHTLVNRIIASSVGPTVARNANLTGPSPIFICGMFRSGSTLAEQLLANCDGVAAGGEFDFLPRLVQTELNPFPDSLKTFPPAQLEHIATRYRAELARVSATARYVIDKRPDNFLYIGLIKRLFPDAKIVHTTRNPLDNCLSIYFLHLDQHLSYALNLMDIGHYLSEYRRLMAHWKTLFATDIFDFHYDALVSDPQPTMQRLCEFLGLDWGTRRVEIAPTGRAIKTASVWQVREPLYGSSSGRARHYASQLQTLHDYLGELVPT